MTPKSRFFLVNRLSSSILGLSLVLSICAVAIAKTSHSSIACSPRAVTTVNGDSVLNFTGQDLRGCNFSFLGRNSSANDEYENSLVERFIFAGANLEGASFRSADLEGSSFAGANLTSADLSNLNASYASFAGSNLTGAILSRSRLASTNFGEANLKGARLENSGLYDASFSGANLRNASLRNSTMYRTVLTGSNLVGADFSGADVLDLIGGNLRIDGSTRCPNNKFHKSGGDC